MTVQASNSSTTARILMRWPEGKRIRGRVKPIEGIESSPDDVHPGKPHRWYEMLHGEEPGTGYAVCPCGAYGVPFRKPRA